VNRGAWPAPPVLPPEHPVDPLGPAASLEIRRRRTSRPIFTEVTAMAWFWLNIPLDALFFLAISGIPFWMVLRHPDDRPASTDATGATATGRAWPVVVAGMTERPSDPAETCDPRELVGASAGDRG
jgi:hypothetical protein